MAKFGGAEEKRNYILGKFDSWLTGKLLDKVPEGIETYHLTLSTILWSALTLIFSFMAKSDIRWLWGNSLMILCHYITDLLDGAVGRKRDTGLIHWGYYMDHLMDYVFLCTILIGYAILLPADYDIYLFFILSVFGAYMVNSFLAVTATNKFKIQYLGISPTEIRLAFIVFNSLFIIFGRIFIGNFIPYILLFSFIGLTIMVYKTQKIIWDIDMKNAKRNKKK